MKTAKKAKQETEATKLDNDKTQKQYKIDRDAADRRKRDSDMEEAKKFLPEFQNDLEKEIEKAIGRGENEASIMIKYPKDGLIELIIETFRAAGYRPTYSISSDPSGPDLHFVGAIW